MKFVHISDLHFDPERDGLTSRNIREQLLNHLKNEGITADELIITGDFRNAKTQKEDSKEIKAVVDYINSIATVIGITDVDHIHVVPGNHDRDRTIDAEKAQKIRDKYKVPSGYIDNDDLSVLNGQFGYFKKVCTAIYGPNNYWNCDGPHTSRVIGNTVFVYLNTAIMHNNDDDRGKLFIGTDQLDQLLRKINKENQGFPIIIMAHHSPDCFEKHEKETVEEILIHYPQAYLYLCGDAHEDWVREVNGHIEVTTACIRLTDRGRVTFLYGDTETQHYKAYQWVKAWVIDAHACNKIESFFHTMAGASHQGITFSRQASAYTAADNYIGRENLVKRIEGEMNKPASSVIVVHGVAGIGKTEVCKAVYRNMKNNDSDFNMPFVDLIGADTICEFIGRIANAFGISLAKTPMEEMKNSLCNQISIYTRSQNGNTFIYLDNFEDAYSNMQKQDKNELTRIISMLSRYSGLRFLISSQIDLPGFRTIHVGPLDANIKDIGSLPEGEFLKLDRVKLFENTLGREHKPREFDALKQLMIETEGHPLAIILSANYGRHIGKLDTLLKRWDSAKEELPADPQTHESLKKALDMTWGAIKKNKAAITRWAIHSLSVNSIDEQVINEINDRLSKPFLDEEWIEGGELLSKYGLISYDESRAETMLLAVKKVFVKLEDAGAQKALTEALSAWIAWLDDLMKKGEDHTVVDRIEWHCKAIEWLTEFFYLADYCADKKLFEDLSKLMEHAENYYSFDTTQSTALLERLIKKTPDDFRLKGALYICWGDTLRRFHKRIEARAAYDEAEKFYTIHPNDRGLAQVYYSRGVLAESGRKEEREEAAQLFDKSERIFTKLKDNNSLAYVHLSRGILYETGSNYTMAEYEYDKAENLFNTEKDQLGMAHIYHTRGIYYQRKKKDNDKALECFCDAEGIFRKEKDDHSLASVLAAKGSVIKIQEPPNWEEAYQCYSESLILSQREQDTFRQCKSLISMIECCKGLGRDDEGEQHIKQARKLIADAPDYKQKRLLDDLDLAILWYRS